LRLQQPFGFLLWGLPHTPHKTFLEKGFMISKNFQEFLNFFSKRYCIFEKNVV